MTKRIYILLIFILGFALSPIATFACSSNNETSCCNKENSKKSNIQDCCKKDKQHSNDKDDCSGSCRDKSCNCPAFHFSLVTLLVQENVNKNFDSSNEKQKPYQIKTYFCSGFHSIWIPPNIG